MKGQIGYCFLMSLSILGILYANDQFLPAVQNFKSVGKTDLQEPKGYKSKTAAVCWSIGATIIPPALGVWLDWSDEAHEDWRTYCGWTAIIAGPIIGPSAGHFYAKQWKRGFKSIGLRLGIGATGCFTSTILALILVRGMDPEYMDEFLISAIPTGLAIVTVVSYDIYDIICVPSSVRKYNETLNMQLKPEINFKEKRLGIGIVYLF